MAARKAVTTINLSKQVLADIRASGVRNVSKYFEDLARADLYNIQKMSKAEKEQLTGLQARLAQIKERWREYCKNQEPPTVKRIKVQKQVIA